MSTPTPDSPRNADDAAARIRAQRPARVASTRVNRSQEISELENEIADINSDINDREQQLSVDLDKLVKTAEDFQEEHNEEVQKLEAMRHEKQTRLNELTDRPPAKVRPRDKRSSRNGSDQTGTSSPEPRKNVRQRLAGVKKFFALTNVVKTITLIFALIGAFSFWFSQNSWALQESYQYKGFFSQILAYAIFGLILGWIVEWLRRTWKTEDTDSHS